MMAADSLIVSVLNSIDISLREIRQQLCTKADESRLEGLERRFVILERDAVSEDAVALAVGTARAGRSKLWWTIGGAFAGQVATIVIFFLTHH